MANEEKFLGVRRSLAQEKMLIGTGKSRIKGYILKPIFTSRGQRRKFPLGTLVAVTTLLLHIFYRWNIAEGKMSFLLVSLFHNLYGVRHHTLGQ